MDIEIYTWIDKKVLYPWKMLQAPAGMESLCRHEQIRASV